MLPTLVLLPVLDYLEFHLEPQYKCLCDSLSFHTFSSKILALIVAEENLKHDHGVL